jgi:hypothetical protein
VVSFLRCPALVTDGASGVGLLGQPKAVKNMQNNEGKIQLGDRLDQQAMAHEMRIFIERTTLIGHQELKVSG